MGKEIKSKKQPTELRPISGRALKSCIDTLRPYLHQARILELFAGQGRFSIQALLEGASEALLVEKNSKTAKEIKARIPKKLPPGKKIEIVCQDVWIFLEKQENKHPYPIIFADPPFPLWEKIDQAQFFSLIQTFCEPGTIFLVKTPRRMLISTGHPGFTLWKMNHFGESQFAYFLYE